MIPKIKQLKILNTREVKDIIKVLDSQWGYHDKGTYVWMMNSKMKIYIVSHDLSKIDLETVRIDSMGLYIGEYKKRKFRLSLEGANIIGRKATKNVVELNLEERNQWMKGEDLLKDLGEIPRFIILKNEGDLLGCGRYKEGRVYNYIPKERRLRVIAN